MIISNTTGGTTQGGMNNTSSILPNSFYANNQTSNPFTQQALVSSTQASVVLCSREDQQRYMREVEQKNRQERVKMVRDQEKQASRLLLQGALERKQVEQERMQEQARYQEYLTKKQEIERLKVLRELEIERQGKAMRDAQDAEEKRLREQLEAKDKAIKDEETRRGRGKQAIDRERRLFEERKEIEEAIKQIERKKIVASQEQVIAREAAQKYREQQSIYDESKMQQSSKMGVAAEVSTLKSVSHVDYTNTRFHNAVVVKNDQYLQNELEKLKKGAYDKAKEEQTKKSIMKAQKENQNRMNAQRAEERGKKALYEQNSKKDKQIFEKEMQKLQIQENLQKIHEAKRGEEPAAMTVMQERKERQKQEKMMKMFEEEIIKKEPKSKSRERVMSADNHPLRQREHKQQPAIIIKVNPDELQIQQARNIMEIRQHHQPQMFSNYDQIRTANDMGFSSQSINQSSVKQTASGAFAINNRHLPQEESDFTLKETSDFNQRAHNYYSPSSDANQQQPLQQQYNAFPNPHPDSSYNQRPSSFQQSSKTNLNQSSNPFFVPSPPSQPRIAPAHNALPQYFNPYLQQHQQHLQQQPPAQVLDQDQEIKISLNHPKQQQMSNVDAFLQDNQEYLEKQDQQEVEDSENPDEYGDEEDESSFTDNNEAMSSSSGSSMTSIVQSPGGQQSIEGAYRMDQIDRIIREARQNKREMLQQQNDSSSASELSESFDDKYLQKYSAISQNQQPRQSNLPDEFLNDDQSNTLQTSSQQPYYQSDVFTKSSYLKQSVPQQMSTIQQKRQIFDYAAQNRNNFKITSGQVDLNENAPMSELSYSYSEMPGGIHQFGQQSQYNGTTLNQSKGPFQSTQTRDQNIKPLRNKGGVKLEIVEGNDSSNHTDQSQKSLADIFKQRRGLQRDDQVDERPKERKPEKTKEELAIIRKQMMKARPSQQSNQSINSSSASGIVQESIDSGKLTGKNSELMSRLARGEKVQVSKKDMLKLTNKNYGELPEVRKKKEDEKKKEQMRERMKQVKELEKQRRELRSAGSSHRQGTQKK